MRRVLRHRTLRGAKPRTLLSGALACFAGYLPLALFAAQQQFFVLDHEVENLMVIMRLELLRVPMEAVSVLGDDLGMIGLIAAGSLLLWRASRRWAIALPVLMAGTGALQSLAKWLADRPRPDLAPWGFPSGHVLSVVVFFGLIVYLVVTTSSPGRRWPVVVGAAGIGVVALVAFSRLYLKKHWISDLAGGFAVGAAYLLLAIWVVEVVLTRASSDDGPQSDTAASSSSATASSALVA